MAAARRKIRPEDIHGLKYFKALQGLIERLHFVGTQRDKAGNRDLHMDQYCSLILLWFFSPIVDSLRGLQQAGTLDKVRKNFGVGRASLGSLSEGVAVFDPEPLKEIAQELFNQLPDVSAGRFDVVGQTLTAVDGSLSRRSLVSHGSHGFPRPRGRRCAAIDCTHSSRCCVACRLAST